jgi:SAM-dependent MidA family methyltransferase
VNLAATAWIRRAARSLERGFLLLIDYGHEAHRLYGRGHAGGTLTTYRRHVSEAPDESPAWLLEPGARDITSHVDLTGARLAAEGAGLTTLGVLDQGYFLLALSLDSPFEPGQDSASAGRRRLALKTLLLPGGLGSTMKVLVFGRAVGRPALKGLALGARLT